MVASPQFLRPTARAEHAAHQIGPVGLAGDEIPGRHEPPGVAVLLLRHVPQGLPRPRGCLPGQRQIAPPVLQFLLDVSLQYRQKLHCLAAHAAGVRLRAGKLALLRRRQFLPSRHCFRRGFRIGLQPGAHPLPEPVMLPEIVDLRLVEISFHGLPLLFPPVYADPEKKCRFYRKIPPYPLTGRVKYVRV